MGDGKGGFGKKGPSFFPERLTKGKGAPQSGNVMCRGGGGGEKARRNGKKNRAWLFRNALAPVPSFRKKNPIGLF